ncbi:MAG: beta-ketoacyl-ACP synthase III [Gammaproteobacteria bacterium]
MKYSRITGTGAYLPERIMPNSELEALVDTSDEWIQSRTGIKQRHIAREDESTGDMAAVAATRALEAAGVEKDEIDLVIVATSTPDQTFPSTACLLQRKLGINNSSPAFDVQAVCSGFVYALSIADKFIKSGSSRCALVIGADCLSKILDWHDRSTCVLFGDGAGAVVLKASDSPGIHATLLHANGAYANMLEVPSGVSRPGNDPFIRMKGNEVFRFAVTAMDQVVNEILADTGTRKDEIDWLVPHQANQRIITATAKKLGMPMSKVILTVAEHANTSAASIPLALDVGVRDGRIKPDNLLMLEAIGGGFAWGAALLRF